jgi:hypothetical protein
MAIQIVSMPISAILNQFESVGVDEERTKKRIAWQGEAETAAVKQLGEYLNEGFQIVDVQQYVANAYNWLRYTLHKPEAPKVLHTVYLEQEE